MIYILFNDKVNGELLNKQFPDAASYRAWRVENRDSIETIRITTNWHEFDRWQIAFYELRNLVGYATVVTAWRAGGYHSVVDRWTEVLNQGETR